MIQKAIASRADSRSAGEQFYTSSRPTQISSHTLQRRTIEQQR